MYLVSTWLGGGAAMMDRVAVQTMVSYWLAQWIRVCEKNVFCQDNVAPEFLFQSQHLLAVTHTAPPRASRHQLPKQRQLLPPHLPTPSPTSQPVHNKQDIH